MRLSRGCYDKFHRCPGWIGGGMKWTNNVRCNDGRIKINYDDPWWRLKFQRCNTCDVVVWPYFTRWFDPTWLIFEIPFCIKNFDRHYWWVDTKYKFQRLFGGTK